MARRATKQKKNGIKRPLRIPPHAPEARDEGPRFFRWATEANANSATWTTWFLLPTSPSAARRRH